jgi:hypothetical protein
MPPSRTSILSSPRLSTAAVYRSVIWLSRVVRNSSRLMLSSSLTWPVDSRVYQMDAIAVMDAASTPSTSSRRSQSRWPCAGASLFGLRRARVAARAR